MMMTPVTLRSADLMAILDPGQGADVLSLVDRGTGVDVLFRSPWRQRADAIRTGRPAAYHDPVAGWLERYRGGWQTLCPNAGEPRTIHGAPVRFHGEAASVAWQVDELSAARARLHVELFSLPVRIDRVVELDNDTLRLRDVVANLSETELEFDYSQHPALGGVFLDGPVRIETDAARFVADPDQPAGMVAGSRHHWPHAVTADGVGLDLRDVPPPGDRRVLFGWLEGFAAGWASVSNPDLALTVRLQWDAERLPYAWFWQELNASVGFPWHRRARAIAIEPATMASSGPDRRSGLRLGPNGQTEMMMSVQLQNGGA